MKFFVTVIRVLRLRCVCLLLALLVTAAAQNEEVLSGHAECPCIDPWEGRPLNECRNTTYGYVCVLRCEFLDVMRDNVFYL